MTRHPKPVKEGLFRLLDSGDHEGGDGSGEADTSIRLVGGFSPTSGRRHFPLASVCPYSGADDVAAVELSTRGTLWAFTAVTAAPPGYRGDVPFGFGVVELNDDGLRVVTRLTEADPTRLTHGQPMRLVADVLHVDDDGAQVVTYAFAPDDPEASS